MERADSKIRWMDEKRKPEDPSALIAQLSKDPAISKLLASQKIPESLLSSRPYTFRRWLNEIEGCRGCRGLSYCQQKQTGYREGLRYDGALQEVVEACPYEVQRQSKEVHLSQYLVSDLGETFADVSFDDIDLSKEPGSYARACMNVQSLCMRHQGCYLYGAMGTGKTYLAACACNEIARNGEKVAFIHAPSFADRLSARLRTGEYRDEVELLKYAQMLVIDDIGAEDVTSRYRSILLSILDSRMSSKRMTWFTSNEDYRSLQNHYVYASGGSDTVEADRIMERIRSMAQPIRLDCADRRHLFQTQE